MCTEGVNGVLSGRTVDLREYELWLRRELAWLCGGAGVAGAATPTATPAAPPPAAEVHEGGTVDPTSSWFTVRYCNLRDDIPVECQLFQSLSVKITTHVVSLMEDTNYGNGVLSTRDNDTLRQRRCERRRRRRQEQNKKTPSLSVEDKGGTAAAGGGAITSLDVILLPNTDADEREGGEVIKHPPSPWNGNDDDTANAKVGAVLPLLRGWETTADPAIHLSPKEWHDVLLLFSAWYHRGHRWEG